MSETPTTETTDAQKRAQARGKAQTRLNEKYRDELVTLTKEEAAKLGVEYAPRKTEKEKAKEQLDRLLAEHPDLIPTVRAEDANGEPVEPGQQYEQGIYPPDDRA